MQAGCQGWFVDPQLVGGLGQVVRPRERLTEVAQADQLPGHSLVDRGFLAGREDRVGGHGAAADVLDFVGDGAAPLSLQQAPVEGDGEGVEVGDSHERVREFRPDQIPGSESSEGTPGVVRRVHPRSMAGDTDS